MGILKEVMQKMGSSSQTLTSRWVFDAKSPILAPPLVFGSDKNIIIGTKDGRLIALSNKGLPLWEFAINHKLSKVDLMFLDEDAAKSVTCMPALLASEGLIVFGSESGTLYAINIQGKLAWEYKTKGPIRSKPLCYDINNDGHEEIIIGSHDRHIHAVNARGKLVWAAQCDSEIESSCATMKTGNATNIVFGTNAGTLYCLSAEGKERWTFKTRGPITAQPVCAAIGGDGEMRIIFGSHDSRLYVLNDKGIEEWHFTTDGKILAGASVADINSDNRLEICVGSTDDHVYMLSPSGGQLWDFETNFWVASSPLIADTNKDGRQEVAIGSYDKTLYVLAAEGEYELSTMPGLANVAADFQNVSGIISAPAGRLRSKVLGTHMASGMITGLAYSEPSGIIIVTSTGKIEALTP